MLGPGPVVDAHPLRFREVVPLAVRVDQRAPALPILGRGLCVDDERVCFGPPEDRIAAAAMGVRAGAVGEGEAVGGRVVVLMLLAAGDHGIGEALVQPLAAGPGDMRHQPVEDPPPGGIGVEAPPDEIAYRPAGLRATVSVSPVDPAEGIADAFLVAEPAHEVAHGDMPEAHHQRVAALIDELVDPARPEAFRQVNVAVGRHHGPFGPEPVETAAGFDAREAPCVRRHRLARCVCIRTHGETRLCGVERYGGVGARRSAAAERQAGNARFVGDKLGAHGSGHGAVFMARDRQVEQHPALARQQIALPGAEDDCVTATEQEAVAGMGRTLRVVAVFGIAEILERALVSPIAPVEDQAAIAERRVRRLQDQDIGAERDQPFAVPRREPDVGHARLRRRQRIDPEERARRDALIGAGSPEPLPVGEGPAVADLQLNEIGHGGTVSRAEAATIAGQPRRSKPCPQPGPSC